MRRIAFAIAYILLSYAIFGQGNQVILKNDPDGSRLMVDGKEFIINGMNWDYFPIGTNYEYILWNQSDEFIQKALDYEMSMLKNIGVNTIRQYTGVPAKWITYIYKNYGIFTVLNHSFGRYGLSLDGAWVANTNYADPRVKLLLLKEVKALASDYKNTEGLLMFLLGNENNYGLFWEGSETEDIPNPKKQSKAPAIAMYKLYNEAVVEMKKADPSHPISICNGDLVFMDIIKKECKDVDILGINIYRGLSFGKMFAQVKKKYGKPVMLTEFGADAFNMKTQQEDGEAQAKYLLQNWKEIYANVAGKGKAGNSLGGFTFQFSDGWWKAGQTINLSYHDSTASWSNGGYLMDYKKGQNNMNEEWFGICAKGPTNGDGHYELLPRAGYYLLKKVHQINPFSKDAKAKLEILSNTDATGTLQNRDTGKKRKKAL